MYCTHVVYLCTFILRQYVATIVHISNTCQTLGLPPPIAFLNRPLRQEVLHGGIDFAETSLQYTFVDRNLWMWIVFILLPG